MEYRRNNEYALIRLDPQEEIISSLLEICDKEDIYSAQITGIGAINDFEVGLYDLSEKKYHANHFHIPAEITSLVGTVTEKDEKPYLHIHMNAADGQGHVYGGHLNRAVVSATCEIVLSFTHLDVSRKQDPVTGLNIFDFGRI